MTKNSVSKISNAFATGGGGVNFEQNIQALFLLSLLVNGFCPVINEPIKRVCFQAKHLGYNAKTGERKREYCDECILKMKRIREKELNDRRRMREFRYFEQLMHSSIPGSRVSKKNKPHNTDGMSVYDDW